MKNQLFIFLMLMIPLFTTPSSDCCNHNHEDTEQLKNDRDGLLHFLVGPLNKKQLWVYFRSTTYGFWREFSPMKYPHDILSMGSIAYDVKKDNSMFFLANCCGYYTGFLSVNILKIGIKATFQVFFQNLNSIYNKESTL